MNCISLSINARRGQAPDVAEQERNQVRLRSRADAARPLRGRRRRRRARERRGAILVWVALLLTMLLGMLGLVIDGGLMMAWKRQAQNAADAAALAAAMSLLMGNSTSTATTAADTYVNTYQPDLPNATVQVNIPPLTGPYAGVTGFAEVLVTQPVTTSFIQVLGVGQQQQVVARAVAGSEAVTAGQGAVVLNPNAAPGLKVSGGGTLWVNGQVYDNSQGGGVDQNGVYVGPSPVAAAATNNSSVYAASFRVVGGVDNPANFHNVDPSGPNPVLARQMPTPDPLINLATPTTALGVNNVNLGAPSATNTNLSPSDPTGTNYVNTSTNTLVLHPGIYNSISITGGNVQFVPGIYVVAANTGGTDALKITGGNVTANGVMFYNTGNNYSATNGTPDVNDGSSYPPAPDGAKFGTFSINAGMQFSPIDTTKFSYSPPVSSVFDGMLFYQRRLNTQPLDIQGNSSTGVLSGTIYAKWANVKIDGQGTYSAQFVIGSMEVAGSGNVTLTYAGTLLGKAPEVFLVE